jgi:hypothetical protein
MILEIGYDFDINAKAKCYTRRAKSPPTDGDTSRPQHARGEAGQDFAQRVLHNGR